MYAQLTDPELAAPAPVVKPKPSRMAALDGLRFLAAIVVVSYHYTAMGSVAWGGKSSQKLFPLLHHFTAYSWMGVQLFFLISGFVICMSSWGRSVGDFFISRVTRLYPAYWAAVLITATVLAIWPTVLPRRSLHDVLVNLTMLQLPMGVTQVDGVYWTLWIEMKFYLLFALVIWRGLNYRSAVAFCSLWTVATVITRETGSDFLDIVVVPEYSPFFVAGIAFYLMYRFRPTPLLWGIVVMQFLLAQQAIMFNFRHEMRDLNYTVPEWPVMVILTVMFAVMALLALGKLSWVRGKWLTTLGALTFPLYLVHENIGWNLIHAFRTKLPHGVLVVLVTLAMLTLAWLINRLVEKPLSKRVRAAVSRGVEEMRSQSGQAFARRKAEPISNGDR
ncbi:acyltransferase [Kitasatospora sp. NPDC002227]|uniref:acyltransferase family protein n=1 Tax=Kitasatospora sp. NPDC002227 TaxID=3154773 RepID=UPI0033236B1C